ncbi:MAG TPA: cytochrome c [Candidatus Methylomirabilis sp.]
MIDRYVSPAELRRLVSALLVVVGFISLVALFGFIVLPGLRFQAHTAQESPVVAVQGDTGWLDPTDTPIMAKQVIPPIDPKTVLTPNPELMARGKALYGQTCAPCHGTGGKGDGPAGKTLNPAPRNFTANLGWKNGTRLEDVYRTLDEGIRGSSMASYNYLSKKDRMALAHVVQSLGAFGHGVNDPQAIAALEKLFASTGEVIPNRIPLRLAVDRLVQEFQAAPALKDRDASPILQEAILDPTRAAQTLAGIPGWQTSERALAKALLPGLPANGFAPAVAGYSPARWKELRTGLLGR